MNVTDRWPKRLWLVRHGQSQGNVARDAAHEAGHSIIDLDLRDVDVPLIRSRPSAGRGGGSLVRCAAGGRKARDAAVLALYPRDARRPRRSAPRAGSPAAPSRPSSTSACASASSACSTASPPRASAEQYPTEAEHRAKMGKFYHRPPGGESWADVILRLRSALNTINLQFANKNVLIVCHQVVVLCIRYILEELTEADILAHRQAGRHPELRHLRVRFRTQPSVAVRAQTGAVEPWRADGGAGHAQDRRARSDHRVAMSRSRR